MSTWMLWMILSLVTGRPLLSLALVVAAVWAMDRYTLQVLPSPLRFLHRWRRAGQLERMLHANTA